MHVWYFVKALRTEEWMVQKRGVRVQNHSSVYFQTEYLPKQLRSLPLIDDVFIQRDVNCMEDLYLGFWYLFSLTH